MTQPSLVESKTLQRNAAHILHNGVATISAQRTSKLAFTTITSKQEYESSVANIWLPVLPKWIPTTFVQSQQRQQENPLVTRSVKRPPIWSPRCALTQLHFKAWICNIPVILEFCTPQQTLIISPKLSSVQPIVCKPISVWRYHNQYQTHSTRRTAFRTKIAFENDIPNKSTKAELKWRKLRQNNI
jgi:hypothetical protein